MPQQQELLFSKNRIETVNIYRESIKSESKTEGAQVKLTATQKMAIKAICQESGIGMSTFIADAIEAYIQFYDLKDKFCKHGDFLRSMLERLS